MNEYPCWDIASLARSRVSNAFGSPSIGIVYDFSIVFLCEKLVLLKFVTNKFKIYHWSSYVQKLKK